MTQLQRGLKNDITEYKQKCQGNDRCDDKGKWAPIDRSIDEMTNRPIDKPDISGSQNSINWGDVGLGALLSIGIGLGLVFAPEITLPTLAVGGAAAAP
jgi:hypothetical protein